MNGLNCKTKRSNGGIWPRTTIEPIKSKKNAKQNKNASNKWGYATNGKEKCLMNV